MKIGLTNDHRGLELKKYIKEFLVKSGYEVIDYGTSDSFSCDFSDYAKLLGDGILNHNVDLGIAICGTGIGMSIALNKIKGIYCAKVSNYNEAFLAKSHNNANCMALGEDAINDDIDKIISCFVDTNFSNDERHIRRISKIKDIENG